MDRTIVEADADRIRNAVSVFVTGNANKLKEVRAILGASPNFPFQVESKDLDCKSAATTLGNAVLSAR